MLKNKFVIRLMNEKYHTWFCTLHLKTDNACKLSKGLDLQDTRHDRTVGKMPCEVGFVKRNGFNANGTLWLQKETVT